MRCYSRKIKKFKVQVDEHWLVQRFVRNSRDCLYSIQPRLLCPVLEQKLHLRLLGTLVDVPARGETHSPIGGGSTASLLTWLSGWELMMKK